MPPTKDMVRMCFITMSMYYYIVNSFFHLHLTLYTSNISISIAFQIRPSTHHLRSTPLVLTTTSYVITLFNFFHSWNEKMHQNKKKNSGLNLKRTVVPDDDQKTCLSCFPPFSKMHGLVSQISVTPTLRS